MRLAWSKSFSNMKEVGDETVKMDFNHPMAGIPFLKKYDTRIIVNVCGKTIEEYLEVVERLADTDVDMLEINVSCPNVKEGGIALGQKAECLSEITAAVKEKATFGSTFTE